MTGMASLLFFRVKMSNYIVGAFSILMALYYLPGNLSGLPGTWLYLTEAVLDVAAAVTLFVSKDVKVYLDDMEITRMPMYRRAQLGVGYLAQEASVFRQMTVENNIMAILEFRKDLTVEQRREKLESLISEFGLEKIRRSKGIQLSGGERRRTEIARALANDPKFLLLDEPFAGVDPIAVQDIQDIVAHLKDRNIGILITDHNVHETLSITDRAYLLYEGRVLHHGTPEEMAADPDVREKYLGRDFELRRANTRALNAE